MFKRIDHVALSVRDLSGAVAFYEANFGFQKYAEHHVGRGGVEGIAYLKLGDTVLELAHMPQAPPVASFHFCLEVEDLDRAMAQLQERGLPLVQPPHPTAARESREEGWRRVVFQGPEGEQIELRG